MKLQTLKPKLKAIDTRTIKVLEAKAGTTPRIYGDTWGKIRQRIAKQHNYTCAHCGLIWRSHIDQIDHIKPLEQGGSNNDSNLQPLCNQCHKVKTASERKNQPVTYIKGIVFPEDIYPSKIPLTIVCGPAGGGKSTYIKQNMMDGDYLIDMDNIRAKLNIRDDDWTTDTLKRSLLYRNDMLRALTKVQAKHAWFIVSAAKDTERKWWINKLKPTNLLIVTANLNTLHSRINSTRQGHRAKRSKIASTKWWDEFTNESKHEIIYTD